MSVREPDLCAWMKARVQNEPYRYVATSLAEEAADVFGIGLEETSIVWDLAVDVLDREGCYE